jgi:CHASE2 domain-containing sensor protein
MGKRVLLRLDGNLEQGFRTLLEIGNEGDVPSTEVMGSLPPSTELAVCLEDWQQQYQQTLGKARISLQKISVRPNLQGQREHCRQAARKLQQAFRHWLDAPTFGGIERRLREILNLQEPVRMLLRTNDRRLHHLPWHVWEFVERYTQVEVALSTLPERVAPHRASQKRSIQVLAILGDRRGIDTEADRQLLEHLPNAEVVFLVEPSRQQLNSLLWDSTWDILFFAGHSETEGEQGRIHLNPQDSLTVEELRYGLQRAIANGLQLAIFNSCDGLGLAYELEQLHLPQLIVMREPVPDRVAQEFLKQFLTAFASGQPLYVAERQARERLQGLEDEFPCASWLPIICQNPTNISPTWQALLEGCPPPKVAPVQVNQRRTRPAVPLLVSLGIALGVIGLRAMGGCELGELWAYDRLMQLQPNAALDPRILIVAVTDDDVKRFGKPLPDQIIYRLLTTLEKFQPSVIGLDIYRDIPIEPGNRELLNYLKNTSTVVAICDVGEPGYSPAVPQPPDMAAMQLGFADTLLPDADDKIRRYALTTPNQEAACPTQQSLGLQVSRRYLSQQSPPNQQPRLNQSRIFSLSPRFSGYQHPGDWEAGRRAMLVQFNPSHQIVKEVTLSQILDRPQAAFLRDRVILIGYIGNNTKDHHPTPVGEMFGVRIHAHIISQLLTAANGDHAFMSAWPGLVEAGWITAWAVMGGYLAWFRRSRRWLILTPTAMLIVLVMICLYGFAQLIWIPLIPAALAMVIAMLTERYRPQKNQP